MKNENFELIAHRILEIGTEDINVTIGKPEVSEDGNDYLCPYAIKYKRQKKIKYAIGVDSIQALQLAIKKIGYDLDFLSETEMKPITWLEDSNITTGFD